MNSHHFAAGNVTLTPQDMQAPAEESLVNGDDGYISDDSSFYGDSDPSEHLCSLAGSTIPLPPAYLRFTTMALTNAAQLEDPEPKPLYNPYEGKIYARQLSEPVEIFLELLPPRTTQRSYVGEWIFIANPYGSERPTAEEWARTNSAGAAILADFVTRRVAIETKMEGKGNSKLAITRKVNPLREKARTAILDVARENGCTDGKWMLFPLPEDVNRVWAVVATATAKGELGTAAKVATEDGKGDRVARLICVYTEDFGNKSDVKRVLLKLGELGLTSRNRGISYKPDVFTYLDITGDNEWGMKPSLYQSKEALAWEI
ncbi:hypothetical protein MMC11_002553 [Xylographa trunciseda]|nr:hypothetical protein [Xylographa trunciseda]